jgi:hypothetical protein
MNGILTNELFVAIVLGMIIQDVRNYLSFEKRFKNYYGKFFGYLLSYIVAVPLGLIILTMLIWLLYLISFLV